MEVTYEESKLDFLVAPELRHEGLEATYEESKRAKGGSKNRVPKGLEATYEESKQVDALARGEGHRSLEATYEESKQLYDAPHARLGFHGLEATYEESKQASEKIPAAPKCWWRVVRSRPRWRAMRGAVQPWAARRTAWARRRTLKGTTGLRSTAP